MDPGSDWGLLSQLPEQLERLGGSARESRELLREGDCELGERFEAGERVETLVRDRSRLVDVLVLELWRRHMGPLGTGLALVAVGGYGRGELHPRSDIDLTVVLPADPPQGVENALEGFVTALWDLGLEPGHSVRTIPECQREAAADITVATTLMEARLLAGEPELFARLRDVTGPHRIWPSDAFFSAKWQEQVERHLRFDDTAHRLEPNIKEGPGGLRDIQMVAWVLKRHFGAGSLAELVGHELLTEDEYRSLVDGQSFLWWIRFALHHITGRGEDRLLFDHQIRIARLAGFTELEDNRAVEGFMQRYYRTVMELSRLNEILLALFKERILDAGEVEVRPINPRFQAVGGSLSVTAPDVFRESPGALLELFRIMEEDASLGGVTASTIRAVREHLDLIDDDFRADPRRQRQFLELLRAPRGVTHELRRMNRYGVLGRYIPAFGRIEGLMQYDLFHAYTVDAHTLFVLGNLRRLALERYDHEFPGLSRIMRGLPKPEILYLAALFHDIAKGRGGDHSELGAEEADAFCQLHGLSSYDTRLVAWLVKHHLALSVTAQKKDISDPDVINAFARTVGDENHLDHLYLLTVADVRATNPRLWNAWKGSLFAELHEQTRRALRRGLEDPIDREELIAETQAAARRLLSEDGIDDRVLEPIWSGLGDLYFLRHSPDEIAWHTRALADLEDDDPLIEVRRDPEHGAATLVLYGPRERFTFAYATAVLDELGLSILDARITPDGSGHSLDTYVVQEDTGSPIVDDDRLEEITAVFRRRSDGDDHIVRRRAPRQVRMFSTETLVSFGSERDDVTAVEIIAGDRPGLLSELGRIFRRLDLRVQVAKITTVGERAEDVFFLTSSDGDALDDSERGQLRSDIVEAIGDRR